MSAAGETTGTTRAGFSLGQLQHAALWLFVASGWLVAVEPSPYEVLFVVALFAFLPNALSAHPSLLPPIAFLLLYNIGGALSLAQVTADSRAVMFTVISAFMAATAVFYALLIIGDPVARFAIISNAYIWAACAASLAGLIGYFDIAGLREYWAPMYRAQGTFKDPNVFSTFLIPPLCFLLQGFMLGTHRRKFWSAVALCLIGAGLFFAFSRGAWVNAVVTIVLLAVISFITHPAPHIRTRIILLVFAFAIATTALIAFALSFESVRMLFQERANLINYYDAGETGRFGNQLNSLPLLLGWPNGMGPMQFRKFFGNDPHNVFINAFAANGWLGGISFLLLAMTTIATGWKTILSRTPLRHQAIAIFCPFVATILQGVQIDIEHWRHLFLMMGLIWGLSAAAIVDADDFS
ncbi:MAG: O-antigen ligase family protein [Aestuariivirgaceae bacterium]